MSCLGPGKTVGAVIRQARLASCRSLRECARLVGITPSYWSDIEHDRRVPAEAVLHAVAEFLGLDGWDLMALAGRDGEQVLEYRRRQPAVGLLLRELAKREVVEEELWALVERVRGGE